MLLKFDQLVMENTVYSTGIPVQWKEGKKERKLSQWTVWLWKSFSASILILPKQLIFECSIFICIHLAVAEYSLSH
jgi:hypothetical protein